MLCYIKSKIARDMLDYAQNKKLKSRLWRAGNFALYVLEAIDVSVFLSIKKLPKTLGFKKCKF
jgi:hypothetical protein